MARGLTASDEKEAKQLLTSVGYFRLKQYISADMLSEEQHFKSGVTFQNIVDRYDFDTEIRNVTFAMCQRVEVTIKATMSQTLSQLYTPVLPDAAFMNSEFAIAWKRNIQIARSQARQRQEPYVSHHWQYYHEFPIWVDLELSTFGALSHLFSWLQIEAQKEIAKNFGVQKKYIWSWLHVLTVVRNLCAHQARLLGNTKILKPRIPNRVRSDFPSDSYASIIFMASVILSKREFSTFIHQLSLITHEFEGRVEVCDLGLDTNWLQAAYNLI